MNPRITDPGSPFRVAAARADADAARPYQAAVWVNKRCGGSPLANPVLIVVTALVALLPRHRHTVPDPISTAPSSVHPARPWPRWRSPSRSTPTSGA